MKKTMLVGAILLTSNTAFAASYVTGNIQFHSNKTVTSNQTSKVEAGHVFNNVIGNMTVFVEYSAIPIGGYSSDEGKANDPYVTLGIEQSHSFSDKFWVALGYHHLLQAGEVIQLRPLFKLGYKFDNGFALENRTRFHIDDTDADKGLIEVRYDNKIAYSFKDFPLRVHYNNVFYDKRSGDDSMDHEVRAQWTRKGVQPYIENRSQGHGVSGKKVNNALVFGASYTF